MSIRYNSFKSGRNHTALSLFELLITLAIFSILVSLSMPSLYRLLERYQFNTVRDQLWHLLYYAKSMAILRQETLIVCPAKEGIDRDWLVQSVSTKMALRHVTFPLVSGFRFQWVGNFQDRGGLYFDALGGTGGQQGRFDLRLGPYHTQLVVTLTGRIREATD